MNKINWSGCCLKMLIEIKPIRTDVLLAFIVVSSLLPIVLSSRTWSVKVLPGRVSRSSSRSRKSVPLLGSTLNRCLSLPAMISYLMEVLMERSWSYAWMGWLNFRAWWSRLPWTHPQRKYYYTEMLTDFNKPINNKWGHYSLTMIERNFLNFFS